VRAAGDEFFEMFGFKTVLAVIKSDVGYAVVVAQLP